MGIYLFSHAALSLNIIITASLVPSIRAAVSNVAIDSIDMVEKASHILVGKVENMKSHWDEERGIIYTHVEVYVEELLKGTLQDNYVIIKHKGGEIGNKGLWISGEPRFILGEKVKAFLKMEETGEFTVLDGWKGQISLISPASSGYSYSGIHWDRNDLPVPYYINENCTPEELQAVQASFQTWEDDPQSFMDYTYMGTTTRGNETDGYNVVSWQPIDGPNGTLAQTAYWFDSSTQLMTEFDIVFDEDETWSTTGEPSKFDVQNVGTHEVGHTLVLEDLYDLADSEQTMYGYSSKGETKKRTLEAGDLAGIRYIYPMPNSVYTITTSPSGLQMEVDGTAYTSPQSFEWTPNSAHTINVPSIQDASINTRYVFIGWSDNGAQQHQITAGASSVTITANYLTQHFATIETPGLGFAYPARVNFTQLGGLKASSTSDSWSDWCDSGSALAIDSFVRGEEGQIWFTSDATSWTINSALTTTVNYVLYYPISFEAAFKNFKGLELSENPSSFTLQFPNDTVSGQLNPSNVYYIQSGTTQWKSIIWQGVEVAPPDAYFDATDGNPIVNCLIYDFVVKVSDLFGLPIAGAQVSAKLSNGRTVNTQTGPDGVAVIHMAPKGRFTASISYMAQTVAVSGDVARAALTCVEVKIAFGLSILILLSVSSVLAAVLVVFLMLRMAKSRRMQMGSLSVG